MLSMRTSNTGHLLNFTHYHVINYMNNFLYLNELFYFYYSLLYEFISEKRTPQKGYNAKIGTTNEKIGI